ncbi:vWA domain-containing protein [Thalassotalea mangrovi]|uniref:VWA domain-containing protein n=1 Tax=Thalassotalea mangrovi TaxID=2572245 RepID=A0A4U1B426_9GAMM|nr:VWA domain-containing protein [Thalassotalea mangrovi]TKB44070.1 VWA domain-containing protein [Thalassotalea mangrovi]
MITFAWPWLALCLPLPFIVAKLLPARTQSNAALKVPFRLGEIGSRQVITNNRSLPIPLFVVLWGLFVLALTRPQWLGEPAPVASESREMMIAVDLSGSMQIEDMELNGRQVNRLVMLKKLLGEFIERRQGDRLGLILFADDAYMQTPMTYDRHTVRQMLDEAVIGLVGQKTAIGDAIALSVKRFLNKEDSNRVLLLLTDGQNTSGKITPEQALEVAVANDVTIYTIGIGAEVMMERSLFGNRKVNPSRDLDEDSLRNIANKTQGSYFRATDSASMSNIYQLLDQLEPVEQEQQQMRPLTALYYYPLALMLSIILFLCLLPSLQAATRSFLNWQTERK